jgi:TonB family protein
MIKSLTGLLAVVSALTGACSLSLATDKGSTILDKDVKVVEFEELMYPPEARASRMTGVVVVRVALDDSGKVLGSALVSGADILAHACLENAKKWKFQPNSERSAILVYEFRMPGGECRSSSSISLLRRPNFVIVDGCDPISIDIK